MPSMSYCVIENLCDDLPTAYEVLESLVESEEPINEYEQEYLPRAIALMRDIIHLYESGIKNNVIDAHGRLSNQENEDDEE